MSERARRTWLGLLLTLCVLCTGAPALAAKGDPAGDDRRARVEERMHRLRARLLRRDVGLDEKKATAVEKILDRNAPARQKLQEELHKHRGALKDLLDQDSGDDAAYAAALAGARVAGQKLEALRQREMDEIAKIITPKQQAKLLRAVKRLQHEMARARRKHDHEREGD